MPELLQMENLSDDVEPQEELLSLLEEVITEDEKKNKGRQFRHQSARDHSRHFPANAASLCTMVRKTEIRYSEPR